VQFQRFLERGLPLVIALGVLLFVIIIAWWVVSIAARGGLIHLVNEAEENRPVRAGDGWRVGFSKWFRILGIQFLAALPILLVVAVMVAVLVAIGFGGAAGSAASRGAGGSAAAVLSMLSGICCFAVVFVVVLIALGVVLTIVAELAVRYAVLRDTGVVESLRRGWADLRAKRGAFLMYLIQWGVSLAYTIVVTIVALVLMLPAVFLILAGGWIAGVLLIIVAVLALMLPAAIYGAFYHAVWTIFFRRMTGSEPVSAVAASGPAFPPANGMYPPPPPSGAGMPSASPAPWESQAPAPPAAPPADPWAAANTLPDAPAAPEGDPPPGA
jgi:hypothetical protein